MIWRTLPSGERLPIFPSYLREYPSVRMSSGSFIQKIVSSSRAPIPSTVFRSTRSWAPQPVRTRKRQVLPLGWGEDSRLPRTRTSWTL